MFKQNSLLIFLSGTLCASGPEAEKYTQVVPPSYTESALSSSGIKHFDDKAVQTDETIEQMLSSPHTALKCGFVQSQLNKLKETTGDLDSIRAIESFYNALKGIKFQVISINRATNKLKNIGLLEDASHLTTYERQRYNSQEKYIGNVTYIYQERCYRIPEDIYDALHEAGQVPKD